MSDHSLNELFAGSSTAPAKLKTKLSFLSSLFVSRRHLLDNFADAFLWIHKSAQPEGKFSSFQKIQNLILLIIICRNIR